MAPGQLLIQTTLKHIIRFGEVSWFFVALAGKTVDNYFTWDGIKTNCEEHDTVKKTLACVWDCLTTAVLYSTLAYKSYRNLAIIQARLRENGWEIGGFGREVQTEIFNGLYVTQLHPANSSSGLTVRSAIELNVLPQGLREEYDTFILGSANDTAQFAAQIWESGLFMRQLVPNRLAPRNNFGATSFTSGGIDFFLDIHTGADGKLDPENDWGTVWNQIECGMRGRHDQNTLYWNVLDANNHDTAGAGSAATVNDDGSSAILVLKVSPNYSDVGLGNRECASINHDELK